MCSVLASGTCGSAGSRTFGKPICACTVGAVIINNMKASRRMQINLVEIAPRGKKRASRFVLLT
jgi:hypothetical protein